MPKALRLTISFLVCCLAYTTVSAQKLSSVKAELASPFFENLYANTYYSLVDRMDQDGYLPESLTGAYDGMFCRTVGAIVPLFLETGRLQQAERTINCALTAMQQNEMDRIPHVIGKKGDKYPIISDEPQIDGQEHVLMAWAMLALKRGHTAFEDRTWPVVRDLTKRTFDRTSFQHGQWSTEPGLVRNIAFEHSHEGRRWDTWDLLTQSFAGATLQDMAAVADRRGETQLADDWRTKLQILRKGIRKKMTTVRGQDTTYLEMRLPDGNGGQPYLGMGWVALSPIAAQWEALDHRVLQHTVKAMQQMVLQTTNGVIWMPTDGYPNGSVSNEIIGKGQAWEMDFARTENDVARIQQILALIKLVNASKPIYMEGAWLDAPGIKLSQQLTPADLAKLNKATWKVKDAGNGEQTAWWCWAMARLRKQVGLPAEPQRPKK